MMDKVKIQEIADEADLSNGELLDKAQELGFDVKAANSTISMEDAGILVDYAISGTLPKGFKKPDSKSKIRVVKKQALEPVEEVIEVQEEETIEQKTVSIGTVKEQAFEKTKLAKKSVAINEGDTSMLKRDEELSEKENKLKQFYEKLKKEKSEFEAYKKSEQNNLKERLLKEELDHKTRLEELKIRTISKLKDEFLENIKNEYNKVNSKLDEQTQKELKIIEWQQKIDDEKKRLDQEQELFESRKEKLLSEYKQELEKDKEIFTNKIQEERVKKLEEVNKTIDELYKNQEKSLESKEEELRKKEAELKTSMAEVKAKEGSLEVEKNSLYTQAQEKIELKIKNYQQKVEHLWRDI